MEIAYDSRNDDRILIPINGRCVCWHNSPTLEWLDEQRNFIVPLGSALRNVIGDQGFNPVNKLGATCILEGNGYVLIERGAKFIHTVEGPFNTFDYRPSWDSYLAYSPFTPFTAIFQGLVVNTNGIRNPDNSFTYDNVQASIITNANNGLRYVNFTVDSPLRDSAAANAKALADFGPGTPYRGTAGYPGYTFTS